ncbi:Flp pilus assembly complex ATPase component TadA (plasmid) [Comamonas aquatica]|nr:Flp pilus assembly complex ATPase component TadA [Comamonas aquatica]
MNALSYTFASKNQVLLVPGQVNSLLFTEQTPRSVIGEVMRTAGQVKLQQVTTGVLEQQIHALYADKGGAARVVSDAQDDANLGLLMQEVVRTQDLLAAEDDAPIVRILNALLLEAVKLTASDIHIEAYEAKSVVRVRVDGELKEIAATKPELHKALISRLKIMAHLDIAESRLPQDGRISTRLGNRLIDIRVSTLPNAFGERAVLRLLDKSGDKLTFESAGMSPQLVTQFDGLLRQPHGIILVTGPTGSGKTTTLYSALSRLDASTKNIMTVEDPIEQELPGIGQTQINAKIGYSFADALRSILRQDPDVVMIGEIRDAETAKIAIQASLTGHLVLATLHTNDASSAVTRLVDMGVEPYLLSSSLLGVLAQRLVRKIDPKEPEQLRGRTGIYELLSVDDRIKQLINTGATDTAIRHAGVQAGMQTMRDYGESLVAQGITTQTQVLLATSNF